MGWGLIWRAYGKPCFLGNFCGKWKITSRLGDLPPIAHRRGLGRQLKEQAYLMLSVAIQLEFQRQAHISVFWMHSVPLKAWTRQAKCLEDSSRYPGPW